MALHYRFPVKTECGLHLRAGVSAGPEASFCHGIAGPSGADVGKKRLPYSPSDFSITSFAISVERVQLFNGRKRTLSTKE